jgi:hypothetical protein
LPRNTYKEVLLYSNYFATAGLTNATIARVFCAHLNGSGGRRRLSVRLPSLCSIENDHPVAPSCLLAERRAAAVIGATANAAAPAEPAQSVLDRAPLIIRDQPDQQEIVLVLNDFSFTAPEEIFANLKNGSNMPAMAEGRRKGSGGGAKPMPASMKDK